MIARGLLLTETYCDVPLRNSFILGLMFIWLPQRVNSENLGDSFSSAEFLRDFEACRGLFVHVVRNVGLGESFGFGPSGNQSIPNQAGSVLDPVGFICHRGPVDREAVPAEQFKQSVAD